MTKSAIITGGAGFIGYHLAKALLKKNFQIFIIDNLSRGKLDKELKNLLKNKKVFFFRKNLQHKILLKIKKIDIIFHLAGSVGVKNITDHPYESFLNNILSLKNIIDFNKMLRKEAKLILFSTSEVYSPIIDTGKAKYPLQETNKILLKSKTSKRDAYYLSKIFNEKLTEISNKNYLILRPHNIYGPRMGFSHVVPELLKKMHLENKKILRKTIIYSPNHKRAFCYIDDAINQIVKLSLNFKIKNEVFNIGNMKEEIKIIDLAKKIKRMFFKKSKLELGSITQGSPKRRVPNMRKTEKFINEKEYINLTQGLKNTYYWYKDKLK